MCLWCYFWARFISEKENMTVMSLPDKQAEVCEIFCGFQLFERAFINDSYLFLVQKVGAPFGLPCENELVV